MALHKHMHLRSVAFGWSGDTLGPYATATQSVVVVFLDNIAAEDESKARMLSLLIRKIGIFPFRIKSTKKNIALNYMESGTLRIAIR